MPVDIETLLRDAEARLNGRFDNLEGRFDKLEDKVDDAADFKAGLQGAARIGMGIIIILGILVGIYVGLKGLPTTSTHGVAP